MSLFGRMICLPAARRLRRDENGASLLEMTVVTPFLVVLGLGLFEFSNMLYQWHLISTGVRDAGRYAAGLPEGDPTEENCTSPAATPVGCAKHLAIFGQAAAGGTQRVSWWTVGDVDLAYVPLDPEDPDLRGGNPSKVVVTTQVVYSDIGFLDALRLGPITIAVSHEERHYGIR
jgi:hypothetical protein